MGNMIQYRVFMIDDDADDRKMLSDAFNEHSNSVRLIFFEDGESFLRALQTSHSTALPDLILLDLNMPGMLGFQVLKELKSRREWLSIPVIILTTSMQDRDKANAYEMGASCFIRKPASYSSLVDLANAIQVLWFANTPRRPAA